MQLVPVQIKDILSQDIDYTNPEQQEIVATNIVENIVQSEDLYPVERTDKLIWVLDMFKKEKAYWKDKMELAKNYVKAMESLDKRLKTYIRKIMVDDEKWLATDQKIVAKNYKNKELSFIDEEKLTADEFTYDITGLSNSLYQTLLNCIAYVYAQKETGKFRFDTTNTFELLEYIERNVKLEPFTISKLPKDHPAIHKEFDKLIQIKPLSQQELKGKK